MDTVGARIAYWRKRRGGMHQSTLAGLAGMSRSSIAMIESGARSVDSLAKFTAIARALQVSVADLRGQPGDPTDPRKAEAVAHIPAIRAALIAIREGDRTKPARDRDRTTSALDDVMRMRCDRSDYAGMAHHLPALLADAAAHQGVLLARAGYEVSDCVRNLGYVDLADTAATLAVNAALDAEDPAWFGATRFMSALAMTSEAAPTAARSTDRAIADLQPRAGDRDVRQMLGQLHLSAGMAYAVEGRTDDAEAHMQAAADEAATLGDPDDGIGFNAMSFGPSNVALWRMAMSFERGEPGRALELARGVDLGKLKCRTRHFRYWLDVGRAHAGSRRGDAEAEEALANAEQLAPTMFGINPIARDTVASMVTRAHRSAVPQGLRVLALRVGVDVRL